MVIKNGLVLTPDSENPQKLDLLIEDGKIIDTGTGLDGGEVLDAKGLLILPGGIDAHVHFNTPGYTHREDFYHGSMAAIAGGITTVIDMPCTSIPPVTNKANLLKKLENIQGKSFVDFAFYGGVSLQAFEEGFPEFMEELAPYVCGFKTYFISGMETFERLDPFRFEMVLKKAGEIKRPVLLHAEDYEYVMGATEFAKNDKNYSAYYHSRPEMAEILAVQRACKLAEGKDVQLHIVHVGTSEAVKIIRGYENVTCETCPHYLEFTWEDLDRIGPPLKTTPPVKSPWNKEKLWDYLNDGWINHVASDHAPAPEEEKFTGPVLPGKSSKITENKDNIDIGVPVMSAGQKVGEVHIGLSKTKVFPTAQKNPMDNVMFGGIAFVIFFLIGLVIAKGGGKSVASSEKLQEELERLKDTVSSLHEEETNLSEIIEKKKTEMADIEKEIKDKEEEINKVNEEYMKISEKKSAVESINKQLEELNASLEEKKKELASIQKEIEERAKVTPKGEEEVLISNIIGEDEIESRVEEKKKQEVELTQRIVAKRREEIALSARIEAKRKELIELERKIEELKGKSS